MVALARPLRRQRAREPLHGPDHYPESAMQVYLVRHAQAVQEGPDEHRPLTEDGRKAARALGNRLRSIGARPSVVLSSPLRRSWETAAALAIALNVETEQHERLRPGCTVEDLREILAGRGESVVVVAHQPDCSRIVAEVTGGEEQPFPPATMVVMYLSA
jgi:phosphohistidine phosphatase